MADSSLGAPCWAQGLVQCGWGGVCLRKRQEARILLGLQAALWKTSVSPSLEEERL